MSKQFYNYLNVYEFEFKLPGSGDIIKFKPLVTNQMKQLLQYEDETDPIKVSEALDKLISSAVVSENFDINEMYLRDRFALLIELRKKSKGEYYEFKFKCPDCGSQVLSNVNLDNLEVKEKDVDTGVINVTDEISVEIQHLKRKDEIEAINSIENYNSLEESEKEFEHWISVISSSIKAVISPEGKDEDLTFEDKRFVIRNTPQSVIDKIGNWFNENWFGVNFTFTMKCHNCKYSNKENIPMNQLFS